MNGLPRWFRTRRDRLPRLLRAPDRGVAECRRVIERSLHDDVAIRLSALAMRLELIAMSTQDPLARSALSSTRASVCGIVDDLRAVGGAIYPPLLVGVGLGPSLCAIAERRHLRLRLDLPRRDIGADARTRTGLLVSDHLHTLCPGTPVRVRVRGRRLVRVRITERSGGRPGRRSHRAVLLCA